MDEELEESRSWGDTIADTRPNPEQLCNGSQFRVILQQGLAALPDTYRVVFMLREVEGLSTADTAKVLGLCVPHVKTRLFRARLKLRKRLSQYCECNRITAEPSMPLRHILGGPQTAQVH
jgi:RNA polymerase sigma-70 factor (ECF subfamily)